MTSRKTAADSEGWRKGQGAYSKAAPIKSQDPWNPPKVTDGISKPGGKYTDNDSGLRNKLPDEATAPKAKDIYDNVRKNSLDDDAGGSRPGPIKYGVND